MVIHLKRGSTIFLSIPSQSSGGWQPRTDMCWEDHPQTLPPIFNFLNQVGSIASRANGISLGIYIFLNIYIYSLKLWYFTVNQEPKTNLGIDKIGLNESSSVLSHQWLMLVIFTLIYIWVWNYVHFIPQLSKLDPTWACHSPSIMCWVLLTDVTMPWKFYFF